MTYRGPLTSAEVETFHSLAVAAYEKAVARQGHFQLNTNVAGIPIDIEAAGEELISAIRPALAGIVAPTAAQGASRILVFDTDASGVPAPQFGRPVQHLIRWRGDCWTEPSAHCRVVFHMSDHTLQVFNPATGICVVMISGLGRLPPWALAAPLRTPLAMILARRGVYLVHGAAMGHSDGAVLVTGYGGSGKSTAALACRSAGMPILGDDYVAIRAPRWTGDIPTVHNVFASLKVMPQEIGEAARGSLISDKRIIYPFSTSIEGLLREAPLRAVSSATIWGEIETQTVEAAPEDVARIAFASTALQIPMDNEDKVAEAILECVRLAGAYNIKFGRERASAPTGIATLLAEHDGPPATSPPAAWKRPGALRPISVVIPIHNGAAFICEAVASVVAQDYPDIEIIVVDDGSTDNLDAALSKIQHPFRLLRQSQCGPAAARNVGIQSARYDWIAFLDADDIWPAGALSCLAQDLVLHGHAGVVRGSAVTFCSDAETGARANAYHPRENYPFYIGGGIYRRRAFGLVGCFDETLRYAEDTDWYWRATELGLPIINIADVVLNVRMHNENMTADEAAAESGALQALKRKIHRARQAAQARTASEPSVYAPRNRE